MAYARENIFKPRLRFRTLEELNGWLQAECGRRARSNRHPKQRDRTVWDVFDPKRYSVAAMEARQAVQIRSCRQARGAL